MSSTGRWAPDAAHRRRVDIRLGVQPAHEISVGAQRVQHLLTHAGHDRHIQHDIDAVGELDADLGEGRAHGAHGIGDDVHRPALHRALEDALQHLVRLILLHPVVGGTCVLLLLGADESATLDARNVVDRRAMQIATGQQLLIELDHLARGARFRSQCFELFLTAVDEHDLVGRAESDALVDEILKAFVFEFHFYLRARDPCNLISFLSPPCRLRRTPRVPALPTSLRASRRTCARAHAYLMKSRTYARRASHAPALNKDIKPDSPLCQSKPFSPENPRLRPFS